MTDTPSVLIVNGPNLNMLGTREPEVYGSLTLADLEAACRTHGAGLGLEVDCRQSNSEAEIIGWLHDSKDRFGGVILNAGAYTHTSVALHDAIKAAGVPLVEVHLSNVYKRESFRHNSFISPVAEGVICGFGMKSYLLALDFFAERLGSERMA